MRLLNRFLDRHDIVVHVLTTYMIHMPFNMYMIRYVVHKALLLFRSADKNTHSVLY
jgi:hypothetical protein